MSAPFMAGFAGRFNVGFIIAERIAVDRDHACAIIGQVAKNATNLAAAEKFVRRLRHHPSTKAGIDFSRPLLLLLPKIDKALAITRSMAHPQHAGVLIPPVLTDLPVVGFPHFQQGLAALRVLSSHVILIPLIPIFTVFSISLTFLFAIAK
jgi:hypothetical protein